MAKIIKKVKQHLRSRAFFLSHMAVDAPVMMNDFGGVAFGCSRLQSVSTYGFL